MITKGKSGLIKLGRTNRVPYITSNIWLEIENFRSKILKIWDIQIRDKKTPRLIKVYLK